MDVVLMVVMVWVALDAIIVWAMWSCSTRRHADGDRRVAEQVPAAPARPSGVDLSPSPLRMRLVGAPSTSPSDRGSSVVPHR